MGRVTYISLGVISLDKFLAHAHEFVDQLDATQGPFVLVKEERPVAVIQSAKEHQKLLMLC